MADVTTKTFDELVQDQATAIQALAPVTIDVGVGTVLRAIVESSAGLTLWLEGLILRVLAMTRAATSTSADLDSWVADFGLTRVAGSAATGNATFSRNVTTQAALVPVGTQIDTSDGARTFVVVRDTANVNYQVANDAYRINTGVGSISVPVRDTVAGAAGNLIAFALTKLTSPIQYVDSVTNPLPFTNGSDPETDAALRDRFVAFLASLSRGTVGAIGFAVSSVEGVASYSIVENTQINGTTDYGFFYVVVDDGSGVPSSALLSAVNEAVENYRAVGVRFTVVAPIVQTVNITANIKVASGYAASDVKAAAEAGIRAYVAGLGLGASLYYTKVVNAAYESSAGVVNVSGVLVGGSGSDVAPSSPRIVVRPGTVTVTVVS